KQRIVQSGGIVRTLNVEERTAWVDRLKPVWKIFENDIGAEIIQAAQEANHGN
ncbi:TPA: C4-dicarboxylate ABC transporter, partial [Candidatus Poribacteria bacterium]|nr:C4-dicarboxylate ABC transporter [Candidatus Poribacteria bacterium]